MAITRSMTRKSKKFSTSDDNNGLASWSNLYHDLLFSVMMQLGVFDFISLSSVCKHWRSVALSNWNKFMVTKQPMLLSISTRFDEKHFYIEDHNKRKNLKITINGRRCVGLTCGYMIFYGKETHDLWLVNPLTRKELHFPGFPLSQFSIPYYIRGILVFSPSMFGYVFVVSNNSPTGISFCLAGKKSMWRNVACNHHIDDLQFFKGKIYMINILGQLLELRLNNPEEPVLTLLEMEKFPFPSFRHLAFVSSGENLYVRDFYGDNSEAIEVDFDNMKWVNSETTLGKYAVFLSDFYKCDAAIKPDTWTHPRKKYERLNFLHDKYYCGRLNKEMWYFPHHCFNENDPDMKNGDILKE